MGGYGSGRHSYKNKAGEYRSIDINRLHREGCLKEGWQGHWVWSRDGTEVCKIGAKSKDGSLILEYRVRQYGADWEPVTQPTRLTYVSCHYGGQRPYFICPAFIGGVACSRRVGKLYLAQKYFVCRHCNNLAYASQSEPRYDRMLRRAHKLRVALGGEAGTANWIAPKPKGMWQRTYQRKRLEIEWCENQANHLFIAKFAHLLSEQQRSEYFDSL